MAAMIPLSRVIDLMAEAHASRAETCAVLEQTPLTPEQKAALIDRMREQFRQTFTGAPHGETPTA